MSNSNPHIYLRDHIQQLLSSFKKDNYKEILDKYSFYPDEWIYEQDAIISKMADCPPEQCWGLMVLSQHALEFIQEYNQDVDKKIVTYCPKELIDYAKEEEYETIKTFCNHTGKIGIIFGYSFLTSLSYFRLLEYFQTDREVKTAIYAIYTRYGQLIEKTPDAIKYIKQAIEFFISETRKAYMSKTGHVPDTERVNEPEIEINEKRNLEKNMIREGKTIDPLATDLLILLNQRIPYKVDEGIIRALRGDFDTNCIANSLVKDLMNKYESNLAKDAGITIDKLRKQNRKIKELRKLVNEGKVIPEILENATKEYSSMYIKKN